MISTSAYILTECLFTFLLLLSLVILLLAAKTNKQVIYAIAGIVLGLGIFVRPVLGIFPLLCASIIYFLKKNEKKRVIFLSLVLFLATSYSFQLSWSVFKVATFDSDTAMSSQLKTAFLCGTYPDITHKKLPGIPYREDPKFNQLMNEKYRTIGLYILNKFKEDPIRYVTWWLFGKPIQFWTWKVFFSDGINFYPIRYSWFDTNPFMFILRAIMLTLHPFLVIMAAIGILLFFTMFEKPIMSIETLCYILCFILLTHFTLIFMILAPFPRYAVPMGPELYFMSTVTLWKISHLIRSKGKKIG